MAVGYKLDATKTVINQDRFVWLTNEGITCGNNPVTGKVRTGLTECKEKIGAAVKCPPSKLTKLGITKTS